MSPARLLVLGALAVIGCLAIPVAAYVAGGRIAGPYAGPRGLATYIGSIYGDAVAGSPWAISLVAAPVLIVAVWTLRAWLLRRLAREEAGDRDA